MNEISIEMFAGNSKEITMPIRDRYGRPVDLTGSTGIFTIAEFRNIDTVIFEKDVELEYPEDGVVKITLHPNDTKRLNGVYPFEIKLTFANNTVYTAYSGWIKINASII